MTHAGFAKRFLAYVLDWILLLMAYAASLLTLFGVEALLRWVDVPGATWLLSPTVIVCAPVMVVVPWLYFALFESSTLQATPGKLALGLRVTDIQGERIGFIRATVRVLLRPLSGSILMIGYFMVAWTQKKQALHDLMADSLVLSREYSNRESFWLDNLALILVLLSIWLLVSLGCGVWWVEELNEFTIGSVPLGFWVAQQGSIYTFVLLILIYAVCADRLERNHGVEE